MIDLYPLWLGQYGGSSSNVFINPIRIQLSKKNNKIIFKKQKYKVRIRKVG